MIDSAMQAAFEEVGLALVIVTEVQHVVFNQINLRDRDLKDVWTLEFRGGDSTAATPMNPI
jgi:hypothetical protein